MVLVLRAGSPISSPNGSPDWVCYTWGHPNCPNSRGAGLSADTRFSTQTNKTEDLSLNLRWDMNETVGLNFDIQKIWSTVVNFDNSMDNKTAANRPQLVVAYQ